MENTKEGWRKIQRRKRENTKEEWQNTEEEGKNTKRGYKQSKFRSIIQRMKTDAM